MKVNRGSAWIKTLTFVTYASYSNDVTNTYVLSIGNTNANHDPIEEKIVSELNDMAHGDNSYYYSTALNKNVIVHFRIIVALGDQPERRHINYLMNGNSLYGSRYGYCCKIQDIIKKLPSCFKCEEHIRRKTINKRKSCNKCLRWDVMSNKSLSATLAPKGYPASKLQESEYLYPIELDWEILQNVIAESSKNYISGEWSDKTCRTYLTSHGINNRACDKMISHCNNVIVKNTTSNEYVSNFAKDLINKQKKQNPTLFQSWEGGPYWKSNIDFKSFIDAIMHLLFLGVTKSSKKVIDMSVKKIGSISPLCKKDQMKYDQMMKWGLEWLKLIDVKSGWVSENYLAFGRIVKWYYLTIMYKTLTDKELKRKKGVALILRLISSLFFRSS